MIIEGSAPPPPQHDPSDPDPIKATYDVYIKPSISDGRQIYVLQFPNRGPKAPYRKEHHTQPTKLRLKPQAGMVELDVPVDAWRNYDRGKGIKWGDAMKQSNSIPGGKSYGLPGGFGIGGNQPGRGRGRGEVAVAVDQERLLRDYASAIHTDRVLTKQTLGGQTVLNEDTTPQYMIGTFRQSKQFPIFYLVSKLISYRSTSSYSCRPYCSNAPSIPSYRCPHRARKKYSCTRSYRSTITSY